MLWLVCALQHRVRVGRLVGVDGEAGAGGRGRLEARVLLVSTGARHRVVAGCLVLLLLLLGLWGLLLAGSGAVDHLVVVGVVEVLVAAVALVELIGGGRREAWRGLVVVVVVVQRGG